MRAKEFERALHQYEAAFGKTTWLSPNEITFLADWSRQRTSQIFHLEFLKKQHVQRGKRIIHKIAASEILGILR